MMRSLRCCLGALWVSGLLLPSAFAQWVTQEIPLQAGWNAVYVAVQPADGAFESELAGLPVEGVWQWNKRFSTREFVVDPETPIVRSPHWLIWLPGERGVDFLSQMYRFSACQSYLIKLKADAAGTVLRLKGNPVIPHLEWYPNALNLVGFPVGAVAPTFAEWFEATDKVDLSRSYENEVYRIDSQGRGTTIAAPARETVAANTAYWVKIKGALDYEAPIAVATEYSGGLDFDLSLREIGMTVQNLSPTLSRTVVIDLQDSEAPPEGAPELAGPVVLAVMTASTNEESNLVWTAFDPRAGISRTLEPGEAWNIRWGVRRLQLNAYEPTGTNGAAYQSVLNVRDADGHIHIQVPVIAEKGEVHRPNPPLLGGSPVGDALEEHHSDEGLWVGQVRVTSVSCPAYSAAELLPVRTPADFRLLLHVDAKGVVRLLQRVYLAWDGNETNGTYRLYAAESLVPEGSLDVKRLSAVTFPLMRPLAAAGDGGLTNAVVLTMELPFDDPTNPFMHRYHPMFDNKDAAFLPYAEAEESRSIRRGIRLNFDDRATEALDVSFYGMNDVFGVYEETLQGLRAEDIFVKGVFSLQRVSMINVLEELPPPEDPVPPENPDGG